MSDSQLFLANCVIALLSVVMLVMHMNWAVRRVKSLGQSLRYVALLFAALAISYSSAEQMYDHIAFEPRHAGFTVASLLIFASACVSVYEDHKGRCSTGTTR